MHPGVNELTWHVGTWMHGQVMRPEQNYYVNEACICYLCGRCTDYFFSLFFFFLAVVAESHNQNRMKNLLPFSVAECYFIVGTCWDSWGGSFVVVVDSSCWRVLHLFCCCCFQFSLITLLIPQGDIPSDRFITSTKQEEESVKVQIQREIIYNDTHNCSSASNSNQAFHRNARSCHCHNCVW